MVSVDEVTGRYALGLTAVERAIATGPDALIAAAGPVLEDTYRQTGYTPSLAMPGDGRAHLRRRGNAHRGPDRQLAGSFRAAAAPDLDRGARCSRL